MYLLRFRRKELYGEQLGLDSYALDSFSTTTDKYSLFLIMTKLAWLQMIVSFVHKLRVQK